MRAWGEKHANAKHYENIVNSKIARKNSTFNIRKERLMIAAVKTFGTTVDKHQWRRRRDLLRFVVNQTLL